MMGYLPVVMPVARMPVDVPVRGMAATLHAPAEQFKHVDAFFF